VREGEGAGEKKVVGEGGGAKMRERERLEGEKRKEQLMDGSKEGSVKDGVSKERIGGEVRVGSVLLRVGGAGKKGSEGDGGKVKRLRVRR